MREPPATSVTCTVRQQGFLGREYVVSGDGPDVVIEFRGFRGQAHFVVDGRPFRVVSRGWRGRLALEQERDGREVAAIERTGILSSRQTVRLPDRQLEVVPIGFWRRAWEVRHGDRVVGTMRWRGVFRPIGEVELSGTIERPFQLLLIVLILVLRRRAAAAAAAAS